MFLELVFGGGVCVCSQQVLVGEAGAGGGVNV